MQRKKTPHFSRRSFLGRAGALIAAPLVVPSHVLGLGDKPAPSERIQVGFIGSGHRSRLLMSQMPAAGEIIAICDCDSRRCDQALKEKKANWHVYKHYRELLEAKDIDAVVVPTTDHGRVLTCIHACQAGKDIYAEKPLTLTIHEGRALVQAVEKYKRVFQTGTQQRSMEMNRYACELVRTGGIGKLHTVLGVNYGGPGSCDYTETEPLPKEVDWDTWLNSTPYHDYSSKRQRGWMGCRAYSGGQMTNWGAHGLDQIQWALGMDGTGPVELWTEGTGSRAPVSYRYANGVVVKLELSGAPMGGAVFLGDKGKIEIDRNRFKATPEELVKDPPEAQTAEIWEGPGWQAKFHIGNWLECIKTRGRPVSDAEVGHRSVSVCHLANIVRQLGRKIQWDPTKEEFVGDEEANTYLERPRRKRFELPELT